MEQWPKNPVDAMIERIQDRFKDNKVTIADLGCGDAKIAQTLSSWKNYKIHSFDLVAQNQYIKSCNIAEVGDIISYPRYLYRVIRWMCASSVLVLWEMTFRCLLVRQIAY